MSDLDEAEYQRWITQAGDTLAFARRSQGDSPAWACFLAEQAAQFAVKGLLHGLGEGGWGHDLDALAATAEGLVPELGAVRSEGLRLSRFYIASRYPDAQPGGVPSRRYTAEDSGVAVADATSVVDAVEAAWAALGES